MANLNEQLLPSDMVNIQSLGNNILQFKGKMICQYDDQFYVYDDKNDLWTEYVMKKVEEPVELTKDTHADDIKRLENRNDFLETEIGEVNNENKRLSMRIRRLEIQSNRRDNEHIIAQESYNKFIGVTVVVLSGFVLWGHGAFDLIKSLF